MKLLVLSVVLVLLSSIGSKLDKVVSLKDQDQFDVDPLGNLYLYNNDSLIKQSSDGKILYRYSNLLRSNLSSIDASNSLKILTLDIPNQMVRHFDNTLAPMGNEINLTDLGLFQVTKCIQTPNYIIAYDSNLHELIYINKSGLIEFRSGNLSQIANIPKGIEQLSFQLNKIIVGTPKLTAIFDVNGIFERKIHHLTPIQWFQLKGKNDYLVAIGKEILLVDLTSENQIIELPSEIGKFKIIGSKLYCKSLNKLYIYSIP